MNLLIHEFDSFNGNRIFILREDLLPMLCGGNKVRIALALLKDAQNKGANTIVGYGNSRSNLCRVLAMLCARERMRCVIISPSDESGVRVETTNSYIIKLCGAKVVTCSKNGNVSDVIEHTLQLISHEGGVPYYIFGDKYGHGNEKILSSAYEGVVDPLLDWSEKRGIKWDRITLAVGTGSTFGGLYNGLRKRNVEMVLNGFTIARTKEKCLAETSKYFDQMLGPVKNAEIFDTARIGGYGITNEDELSFILDMMRNKSILFDSTYSGKALWGTYRYLAANKITGENILFVHTGSMPLAIDMLPSLLP